MAKWGEGDPRWIVEERADATNVNNWHWTEKNATPWSKDKIKELFTGLKIENNEISAQIKEVTKCEGEASANNRKAKLIFFYEWVITGDWEATYKNVEEPKKYKGSFEVPNLSEENEPQSVDVNISIKDEKQQKIKDFMRTEGTKVMRQQFAKYIQLLREEFSQGLILPTAKEGGAKDKSSAPAGSAAPANHAGKKSETGTNGTSNGAINESVKIVTKKLTMNEEFKCRSEELYEVFTDVARVRAFTQSSNIVYEPEKGGKFALFDSNITGTFTEFVPNKRIGMNWRNKRWPDEHYSQATLEFTEKEDCTLLSLVQTGIPHNFVENTEDGWRNFYFNSIKQTFGFGSRLF